MGSCLFDLIDLAIQHCIVMKWEPSRGLVFANFVKTIAKAALSLSTTGIVPRVELLASCIMYDSNWDELPYFISTSMTAFATSFMEQFDADLLLGQIAYKQKADIYNYCHKYEQVEKSQTMRNVPSSIGDEDDSDSSHTDPQMYHSVAAVGQQ